MTHRQPGSSTTRERAITGGVTDFGRPPCSCSRRLPERAIAMLEALDPAGDGFRYATTRRGESSMIEDVCLDPQALLRLIREVEEVLGAAGMAFQAEAEVIQEMLELRYGF